MGEASEILSVKDHILRYWEKSFKEYFAVKRVSNRRMFQKKDLITFLKIKELTDKGLNIKAIKKVLDQGSTPAVNEDCGTCSYVDSRNQFLDN